MTWTEIRNKLRPGDEGLMKGLCMRDARSTKVVTAEIVGFVDRLVTERNACETVEAWHARLAEVTRGADIERLVRIIEAVTGVTNDQAFPTEDSMRRIRQAAALRQRRPAPVPVDPTLQSRLDFPLTREGMQAIVEAHVRAWLTDDQGLVLPSPVKRFVRVRKWGEGKYAARVRLFDDVPATIYVEGKAEVGVMPNIRFDGPGFFFHRSGGDWHRLHRDQSRADALNQHGHDFA